MCEFVNGLCNMAWRCAEKVSREWQTLQEMMPTRLDVHDKDWVARRRRRYIELSLCAWTHKATTPTQRRGDTHQVFLQLPHRPTKLDTVDGDVIGLRCW